MNGVIFKMEMEMQMESSQKPKISKIPKFEKLEKQSISTQNEKRCKSIEIKGTVRVVW